MGWGEEENAYSSSSLFFQSQDIWDWGKPNVGTQSSLPHAISQVLEPLLLPPGVCISKKPESGAGVGV